MTVSVYARHSSKCSKSGERGAGQYKRCKCPLWLRWGTDRKKSAKTRSWDIATKAARKFEQELELVANGIESLKKPDHITIQSAVDLYLNDMRQRALAKPTVDKARRMVTRLLDYANARGTFLLKDVTPRLLIEWRGTWTFKAKSSSPAVHWAVWKTFSKWAFRSDLIEADPSAKLKALPSEHNQVQPLTQGEMQGILSATDDCGFSPEVAYRVKTVILLMRWSGLTCGASNISCSCSMSTMMRSTTMRLNIGHRHSSRQRSGIRAMPFVRQRVRGAFDLCAAVRSTSGIHIRSVPSPPQWVE